MNWCRCVCVAMHGLRIIRSHVRVCVCVVFFHTVVAITVCLQTMSAAVERRE